MSKIKKFVTIFKINWQNTFVYRLNFIMWRTRQFLLLVGAYFIWVAVYKFNNNIGGYNEAEMLTYFILARVIGVIVFPTFRSGAVAHDIARGELSKHLLKPISYLKKVFAMDIVDKTTNIVFSFFEFMLFFIVFRPPFFVQKKAIFLLLFGISLVLAVAINFYLSLLIAFFSFWYPEHGGWAARFLFDVVSRILTGQTIPLDILPNFVFRALRFLPSAGLTFIPLQIYLGKISQSEIFLGLGLMCFWLLVLPRLVKYVWGKGLKNYTAVGI